MNLISVTAQRQHDHLIYVCDQTKTPYANLAQLRKIFPKVSVGTLHNRLGLVQENDKRRAEIHTTNGSKLVHLYPPSVISSLAFEFDLPLAKAMAEAGAATYLYGLAGYKVTATAPVPKESELSRLDLIQLALKAETERLALEAQIAADEPATTLGKMVIKAKNNIRIGDFAKSIGLGQNRYFQELRDGRIIQQTSTLPYQRYLDAGYFVVTQIIANGRTCPVALVTPKGQPYLAKRHQQFISRETVRDAIEAQVTALV